MAQNLRAVDGQVTNMSAGDARGRELPRRQAATTPRRGRPPGYNFQEQWKRALELDPPFVMVTGWNEWIAGRFGEPGGPVVFVDQFDQEFSRDIEPMKGGHGDNYYYQLVANVRRYKGVAPLPHASAPRTIDIDGGFEPWRDVAPEFPTTPATPCPATSTAPAGLHYANRTGRNDLVALQGRPRRGKRLLLRPHARAAHPAHRPELDVALHRRRPRRRAPAGRATTSS